MAKSDEQLERQDAKRAAAQDRRKLPDSIKPKGGVADWHNADPTLVFQCLEALTFIGGAIRFGYTRDGGAYSIGLYLGEDSKTIYCNEADGINGTLAEIIEYFGK